jgi:hypothetical protein
MIAANIPPSFIVGQFPALIVKAIAKQKNMNLEYKELNQRSDAVTKNDLTHILMQS